MCCVNSHCLARKPEHLEVTMSLFSLVQLWLWWTRKRFILKKSQWNVFSPCTRDLSISKMSLIPWLMCVCSVICRRDLGALTCASTGRMSFRRCCSASYCLNTSLFQCGACVKLGCWGCCYCPSAPQALISEDTTENRINNRRSPYY